MIEEPTIEFAAFHLRKGGRQQFIASWSLKTILFCLGPFAQDETQGSGLRLMHPRLRRIANRWLSDGFISPFAPLIVAVEIGSRIYPLPEHPGAGLVMLQLPLSKVVDVCDGIHRIAALRELDLSSQSLGESEWPIEFIECADSKDAEKLIECVRKEANISPRKKEIDAHVSNDR